MQNRITISRNLIALLCSVLLLALSDSSAQAFSSGPPKFDLLKRGVNASDWFSAHGANNSMTSADLSAIKNLGFDFVRILVDPRRPMGAQSAQPKSLLPLSGSGDLGAGIEQLDSAVKDILSTGLNVVITVDPTDDYRCELNFFVDTGKKCQNPPSGITQQESVEQTRMEFKAFWAALASHYASSPSDRVFFEIINESRVGQPGVADWARFENDLITLIDHSASGHWIIAAPGAYSGLEDLMKFTPERPPQGAKVIYTFHFYKPFYFAQGPQPINYRYPSRPDDKPELTGVDLEKEFSLNEYNLDQWNSTRIASEISFARRWSAQNNLPVWCGEFGAYRPEGDSPLGKMRRTDRANWLGDVRKALEEYQIGWAVWDYNTSDYGVFTNGAIDAATRDALLH